MNKEKICKGSFNSEVLAMNEKHGKLKERVRDKSKGRSNSQGSQKKAWKCFKCHKPGHLRKNCSLLKKEKGNATNA